MSEERITFINLLTTEVGTKKVLGAFPNMKMITASVEPELNEARYLVPGLGDFGDRYFGSKLPQ